MNGDSSENENGKWHLGEADQMNCDVVDFTTRWCEKGDQIFGWAG